MRKDPVISPTGTKVPDLPEWESEEAGAVPKHRRHRRDEDNEDPEDPIVNKIAVCMAGFLLLVGPAVLLIGSLIRKIRPPSCDHTTASTIS